MIRLGTRRSALAVAQARLVADGLGEAEIVPMSTAGDRDRLRPFDEIGDGRGVFTSDIEQALAEGVIDAAVHSAKDLTADMPEGLVIGAILERDDARDAVCGPFAALEEIPDRARMGTSSARRTALLAELRPGLTVVPMRGNVDTRLAKLAAGEADAIVLAAAGLRRLGLTAQIGFLLDPQVFVPEAGQGAIVVQVRRGEEALVAALDHGPTRRAVEAEREFAQSVGGGCSVPVAAYAWHEGETLRLRGWVAP
jgi:hydroxymethylbilane synthase